MLHDADSLAALRLAGAAPPELSALGGESSLALDLGGFSTPDSALDAWLESLACPVIGLGDGPVFCDAKVPDEDQAGALQEAIARHPVAAASFVHLLRITADMPLLPALGVESAVYSTLQAGAEYQAWLAENRAPAVRAHRDAGPAVEIERDGGTVRLRLNRPSTQNAMSVEMRDALVAALRPLADDPQFGRLEIDGRGTCFSTGGELSEFGQVPDPATGHIVRLLSVPGRFLAPLAARATVQLHGACVGSGIEFPAFAGEIVARPDAQFSLPEVGMGLIPGAGGCISIARRIGRQRLAWWGLSGATIDAEQAREWGLADRID